ncbi:MAG: 16S rRNA (adenine(1518)-N(6)/adenine(1519)-N(6))-dimethyltransferase RsmA [Bacteroidia bacterium]
MNNSGIKAKKHLGQHFLKDQEAVERISQSLLLAGKSYEKVLEIGPGLGVLTKSLLQRFGEQLYVVEIDADMVQYLKKNFPALNGRLLHQDFLNADLRALFGQEQFGVTGNFPYNISSQILFRVLHYRDQIPELTGMFQREVAKRVASGPGTRDYGILSVLVQAFYETSYLFTLDENAFSPSPKVKSGVLRMERKATGPLDCDENFFFRVVKTAFNQRRKTLRNALKIFGEKLDYIETAVLLRRAEQLEVEDFIDLTKRLQDTPPSG